MAGKPDEQVSEVSRRRFLHTVSAGVLSVGFTAWLAGLESCNNPTTSPGTEPTTGQKVTLTLANEPTLQSVGGFVRRTFGNNNGGNPVLVVRTGSSGTGAFRTMSVVCTHAGCLIDNPSGGQCICECHGSVFGAAASNFASNLGGPAPSPLQTFSTTFDGTTVTITM